MNGELIIVKQIPKRKKDTEILGEKSEPQTRANYQSNPKSGSKIKTKTGPKTKTKKMTKIEEGDIRYDEIIDLMIKGKKLRFLTPKSDLVCIIDSNFLEANPDIHRILSYVYDVVLPMSENGIANINDNRRYDKIKEMIPEDIGKNDDIFDDDYEYTEIKATLSTELLNHFMIKEHDIEIKQRHGFNFDKNKIKFKKGGDPRMKIVTEVYDVPHYMIKPITLKYYHTFPNIRYRPHYVKPLFDNIELYDYITPIEKLANYHTAGNYYQKLLDQNRKYLKNAKKQKLRLNLIDDISPIDRDTIILEYIKSRPSMYVITIWPVGMSGVEKLIEYLEKEGNVCYVKMLSLSHSGMRNIIYSYYDEFSNGNSFAEKKAGYTIINNDNNPVCVIFFDNIYNKPISGQSALFKEYIRKMVVDIVDTANTADNIQDHNIKFRGNDMIHVNDYFYQTVEYSQLILNENSIDLLNNQNISSYHIKEFALANLKFQTLRNVTYSNFSLLEIDRLLNIGGVMLYSYGIRSFNDIDMLTIDIEPNKSPQFDSNITKYFTDNKSKIFFLDASIDKKQIERWWEKDKKIFSYLKIADYIEATLNPSYHYYFQGMKIIIPDCEFLRKLVRNRTEDHVDFIMLGLLYPNIVSSYFSLKSVDDFGKNTDTNINYNSPYFIFNEKYKDIVGNHDTRLSDKKHNILIRRYTNEQIYEAKKDPRFSIFFDNTS